MDSARLLRGALNEIAFNGELLYDGLNTTRASGDQNAAQIPINVPSELDRSRKRLAEAAARILQLTTDPTEYLDQLAANTQNLICLRWLVNLHILDHVPLSGGIGYSKLALLAHVPEPQLKGVARMAITNGFLLEVEPDLVSHSRTSALLVKDPSFMNWARWMTNYSVPTAYRLADATKRWGATEAKNETAFNLAMDMSQPFFDYMRNDSEMNTMFSSYMRNVASTAGISFQHLINGYAWKDLSSGSTVVDVGGSSGHASKALAEIYEHLNFIVQDLPETIVNAKKAAEQSGTIDNASISSRIKFMDHDFFEAEPVIDADIYLLRMIIHDWPDAEAIQILSHIKGALKKPGARILVMDTVLPQPGTIPVLQERQLRVRDLTMMQVFNAKERELEDWKTLVEKVGLKLLSVKQPRGSVMGILELVLPTNLDHPNETAEPDGAIRGEDTEVNSLAATAISDSRPNDLTNGISHKKQSSFGDTVNGTGTKNVVLDSSQSTRDVDNDLPTLIIGAGIGGLCLAQGLQKTGEEVLIFERDLSEAYRPQGYRLKIESDAAEALHESLPGKVYESFEASCAISTVGETDFDPISGLIIKSRAGGGLAGQQGLRATFTVDRAVFRNVLMTGIEDKIKFGKELASYEVDQENHTVVASFRDGTQVKGKFLVGADGSRSVVRKLLLPDHQFLDTGAVCIYGKTPITPDLLARYPAKGLRWMTVCADNAPLIQSILIGDSPLTLLSEPIRFEPKSRFQRNLPDDYVYWVLIGRKEIFAQDEAHAAHMAKMDHGTEDSARLSLDLTKEWDSSLRSLFELQDARQCSTMRVISASPQAPAWKPSASVTLIGDAIHAMSPCGGVGANTALRDAAELAKTIAAAGKQGGGISAEAIGAFEEDMRKRTFRSLMRSFAGSKKMFDQQPFEKCQVLDF